MLTEFLLSGLSSGAMTEFKKKLFEEWLGFKDTLIFLKINSTAECTVITIVSRSIKRLILIPQAADAVPSQSGDYSPD